MGRKESNRFDIGARLGLPLCVVVGATAFLIATNNALAQVSTATATPLSYTLKISASGVTSGRSEMETRVNIDGDLQRYDTTVKLANGYTFDIINLLDSGAKTLTTIDPDLGEYTVNDFSKVRPQLFGVATLLPSYTYDARNFVFPVPDVRAASQSGTVYINTHVVDKGMETFRKTKNAHHYTVYLDYTTTGSVELPYASELIDVWTDDSQKQPMNGIAASLLPSSTSVTGASDESGGGVTYRLIGDVDQLSDVMTSLPLRTTYHSGTEAGAITYSLTDFSDKPIGSKLFTPPGRKMRQRDATDFEYDEHTEFLERLRRDSYLEDNDGGGMRLSPHNYFRRLIDKTIVSLDKSASQ